jgi:hypothetical protein
MIRARYTDWDKQIETIHRFLCDPASPAQLPA